LLNGKHQLKLRLKRKLRLMPRNSKKKQMQRSKPHYEEAIYLKYSLNYFITKFNYLHTSD